MNLFGSRKLSDKEKFDLLQRTVSQSLQVRPLNLHNPTPSCVSSVDSDACVARVPDHSVEMLATIGLDSFET